MFRFIRRLITLMILLSIGLVLVILFLPRSYEREYLSNIARPRAAVFQKAMAIRAWNLAARMEDINVNMPEDLGSEVKIPGVNMDSVTSALRGFGEMATIRCKIVQVEEPHRLVYELSGGPLDGLKPEMIFQDVEGKSTLVTLREKYQFTGLLGGIKAFSAKFAMQKLNEQNLENLKRLCEHTP